MGPVLTAIVATSWPTHLDSEAVVGEVQINVFPDTCNVYVLQSGAEAVLVDFGDGNVLDHLADFGVERVTDVLLTHHHRDQLGGLRRAADEGIRIWAPPAELELVAGMDERWQRRSSWNDYDVREDRFSLLESVPVTGTVDEYRTMRFGDLEVYVLPTPGHTLGSCTYLVGDAAFTGDLIYGDGQVWSLAATQWTYSGVEGWGASIVSAATLAGRRPRVLYPSHGAPIEDPGPVLAKLSERLQELIDLRLPRRWDVAERLREPFEAITPHLLRNRTMFATNYVLISETGAALLIDFGYDVSTTALPTERTARRTLLWSLDGLRRDHGVERIEAAVMSHYHDDHVAGLNLLRAVEGAEIWAPENVAPIIEAPERYDLPCLWFDAIPVDRVLQFEQPVQWHEYELTVYPLPGHTQYAAAIGFEVDGTRILVTGDQQTDEGGRSILNYQYRNRFVPEDFARSAELYARLRPQLLLGGHWLPLPVTDDLLGRLAADARRLTELHAELLPAESFGTAGFAARIEPYRPQRGTSELTVTVRNPFTRAETARVRIVATDGLAASPAEQELALDAHGEGVVTFRLDAGGAGRVAADVTIGETAFGQQAEAVVQ
jgi:glyoxylase-like metal-dependent hydrolase (beta-lactamase superfamily II)